MRTALLALLISLALPAAAGADARWVGFNDNATSARTLTPARDSRLVAELGGNSNRLTVEWRYAQQAEGAPIGFGLVKPGYDALLRRGVRPLITLLGAPRWAWMPFAWCSPGRPCHFPPDRSKDEAWRAFVTAVAEAFPLAVGIEVWNEPNLRGFWESGPDPVRYAEIARIAYDAVKAVDPAMPVIGPGLAPVLTNERSGLRYGVRPFLREAAAAGARHDGLSIHPYVQNRPHGLAFQTIAIAREAGGSIPLWLTETGYNLAMAGGERRHAVVLGDLVTRLRRRPGVEAVYVHELLERPREPGFGVLRADGTRRPAACVLTGGCPQAVPAQRRAWEEQERVMQKVEAVLAGWDREETRVCEGTLCVTMRFGEDWDWPW